MGVVRELCWFVLCFKAKIRQPTFDCISKCQISRTEEPLLRQWKVVDLIRQPLMRPVSASVDRLSALNIKIHKGESGWYFLTVLP